MSSRTVFTGRIFNVTVEPVTLPNGARFDAEIIRHPGSVVIAPVTDAGEVILVRQYRHALRTEVWELPAGSLKAGEALEPAASRECHEEIGLVPERLERIGSLAATPGYCDEVMHIFRATGLRAPRDTEAAQPDEDEDLHVQAFTPEQLRGMIVSGDLTDMKTVAALGLLGLLQARRDER